MEILRNIYSTLHDDLQDRRPTLLIGARQVGKTFLMRRLQKEAHSKGLSTVFFDLEQPGDAVELGRPDNELVEFLKTKADVVFIDEFHYLKNASHVLKAVFDSGSPTKIVASGSSAMEIHRHLKESLAGRKVVRRIFPCSYGEMASVNNGLLDDYFIFGGMPGTIHLKNESDKKTLLADILQSYVLKDIKSLIREENIRAFNMIVYLLAQRQGSLISAADLAREIGMTVKTVESYLEILSQTYVATPVASFSNNLGNELKKSRKIYLYDPGIRNAVLRDFRPPRERPDGGAVAEGFVFNELLRLVGPESEIRFWRTKAGDEVDFIWLLNRVPYPIEVKLSDAEGRIPKGLVAFMKRYPDTRRAYILHGGASHDTQMNGANFHFRPLTDAAAAVMEIVRG